MDDLPVGSKHWHSKARFPMECLEEYTQASLGEPFRKYIAWAILFEDRSLSEALDTVNVNGMKFSGTNVPGSGGGVKLAVATVMLVGRTNLKTALSEFDPKDDDDSVDDGGGMNDGKA